MGQSTWWEETMCPEGELSTAIREPGTLCVPVTGMRVGWRHMSSAEVWAINLVGLHDLPNHTYIRAKICIFGPVKECYPFLVTDTVLSHFI